MCQVGDQQSEQEDRGHKGDPVQEGMNALHLHVLHPFWTARPSGLRSLGAWLRVLRAAGCGRLGVRLRCVLRHVLPATPITISRTVMTAATMPNAKTDLLPPFEPSSMSAMAISPISFCPNAHVGVEAIKNRGGSGRLRYRNLINEKSRCMPGGW